MLTVVEEVLVLEVLAVPQCRNTLLQVKVLHLKFYLSISDKMYLKYQQ